MSTFAESLSQGSKKTASHHIRQNVLYCADAIKHKCLDNRSSRYISGFISSYNNEPPVTIVDRLSYEPSAAEAEKIFRKSTLHKPSMESKSHLYQDSTGKCFRQPILECSSEDVPFFSNALKEVILNLGFSKYKVTPIALKHVERTITPASIFSPVKVIDKTIGSPCYMFHIEIRW